MERWYSPYFLTEKFISKRFWLEEPSAQCLESSASDNIHQPEEANIDSLGKLRIENINKLIISTLHMNSVSSKFDQLKCLLQGKVDTLVLTESKLNSSFRANQFLIEGYFKLFIVDRNRNKGGVLSYIREDILWKKLKLYRCLQGNEGYLLKSIEGKPSCCFLQLSPTFTSWWIFLWRSSKYPRQIESNIS